MEKGNVVLIGMPGAGKSTIGVLLAKSLAMPFVDTDIVIQQKEAQNLQSIIDSRGLENFLKIEENIILSLEQKGNVIATGGSAVYSRKALNHLKGADGLIIYFKVGFKTIERRLRNIKTRGVAMNTGMTLFDLYRERAPLYLECADKVISCSGKYMEELVSEAAAIVKDHEAGLH